MTRNEQPTLVDSVIRRLKNRRWIAAILVLGGAVTFLAESTEAIDKLLVALKLRPDAVSLTRETQRDELSRELTRSAWSRLFWMRAYLARVRRAAPKEEQDVAWSKHIESAAEWASQTMVFLEAVNHFYGANKASCLETQIQPQFNDISSSLADFRYSVPTDANEREQAIDRLNKVIDDLNFELYLFVRGFRSRDDSRPTSECGNGGGT